MARGKGKAGPSISRFLSRDDPGAGAAESCPPSPPIRNVYFETETDVEDEDFEVECPTIVFDVDSRNDENETTEEDNEENVADIETYDGEDVVKEVEFTDVHRTNENTIAEESNEECVDYAVIDGRDVLKEVVNGEVIAEMAIGDGEDILKEEGNLACIIGEPEHEQNTENNEEDADNNGEANHEDLFKEEHLAREENEGEALCMVTPEQVENDEHSTEENNKEKLEKSSMQRRIKSRKRKRGKGWVQNSLKKFSSEGKKKKKVLSNGEEDAENEGDALSKDDSTREDIMEQDNGEENTEEDNKKKVEESLKQKLTKYRKRKRGKKKKRLEKSVLENVASEGGGEMCPKEMTSNGDDKESLKVGLKGEDDQGLKKGVSKGEALLGSKNVAPQGKDVPESSRRKKSSKKAESAGLIFLCNSETKKDCYRYNILGLPANKREVVENVYKGMRLFLYDVDLKLMYGIYKATRPGGYNIEPKAFKSQFPSQVSMFAPLEA